MELISLTLELFRTTLITIPFIQLFLLLIIGTLLLLFGKIKFALLINYLFTFYWGFRVNFEKTDVFGVNNLPLFSLVYLGFGSVVVMLVLLSFRHTKQE
jgi:hypothetical protein